MGLEVGARRLVDRLTLRGAKSLGEHVIVKRGVADCLKDAFRRWWPFADFATARTALALLAPPRSSGSVPTGGGMTHLLGDRARSLHAVCTGRVGRAIVSWEWHRVPVTADGVNRRDVVGE